jgi:hypothetical protein
VGKVYSETLTATGDTPITWSIVTGNLPDGLTLSDEGVISGTPTAVGKFNFTVKATNEKGEGKKSLSITIAEYGIGDTGPGGGEIFYYSEAGFTMTDNKQVCHYLEAAPANLGATNSVNRWGESLSWASSEHKTTNIAGTERAIGTGRKNTALILAKDAYYRTAAGGCNGYTNNDKRDWFLPSMDELNELYKNRSAVGNIFFDFGTTPWFWSSTQNTNQTAVTQHFQDNGIQFNSNKGSTFLVRAVRAF